MHDVRIGTSGWSYPSGPGTWNGIFYPAGRIGRSRGFDELAYYADHFSTVEVNASFYRVPDPAVTRKWAQRTPRDFDFSVKLFQKFTHPVMHRRSAERGQVPESEPSEIPLVTAADVDTFRAAIAPLAEAGKLAAVLAQFPPSFRESPEARGYLDWLLHAFKDVRVAVELRHRSWSDRAGETLALLGGHKAAWAQIDEPKFRFSIRQNHLPNVRGFYYMRLHGRNAARWWTHDHPDDRYNYLYTPQELQQVTDTISTVRRLVQTIYVYLNNHFAAKSVANAAVLRHGIGQGVPGPYSHEMLRRYGFLRPYVREEAEGEGSPLFGDEDGEETPAGDAESQGEKPARS